MKINSAKDLGLLVRDQRKAKGWTQAKLASKAGVKPLWVSQFERGKPTAQVGLVFQTLKALSIQLWNESPDPLSDPDENGVNLDDLLSNT